VFTTMFGAFAILALVLAAVGLYAVTAYSVTQHTRDIGMRMVLGAKSGQVIWLFLRRSLMQLVIGLAVGLAAALALAGERPRRAAAVGLVATGVTSAVVNVGVKPVFRRERPPGPTAVRTHVVRMPTSASYPSGHAASAFAFSTAVGGVLPQLDAALRLAATAVAYSRVHTGVHFPGDVVAGAVIGAGIGAGAHHAARRAGFLTR
jgi:undecaprenyl-diphosphatase